MGSRSSRTSLGSPACRACIAPEYSPGTFLGSNLGLQRFDENLKSLSLGLDQSTTSFFNGAIPGLRLKYDEEYLFFRMSFPVYFQNIEVNKEMKFTDIWWEEEGLENVACPLLKTKSSFTVFSERLDI